MLLYALLLDIQESPDSPMTIDYMRVADAAARDAAAARASVRPVPGTVRTTTFTGNVVDTPRPAGEPAGTRPIRRRAR